MLKLESVNKSNRGKALMYKHVNIEPLSLVSLPSSGAVEVFGKGRGSDWPQLGGLAWGGKQWHCHRQDN